MKKIAILLMLVVMGSGYAALPPLYQSLKEYKALIDDPRLTENLTSGETVLAIEKEYNNFTVITNEHRLNVKIVYDESTHPGPVNFHLEFSSQVGGR